MVLQTTALATWLRRLFEKCGPIINLDRLFDKGKCCGLDRCSRVVGWDVDCDRRKHADLIDLLSLVSYSAVLIIETLFSVVLLLILSHIRAQ